MNKPSFVILGWGFDPFISIAYNWIQSMDLESWVHDKSFIKNPKLCILIQ